MRPCFSGLLRASSRHQRVPRRAPVFVVLGVFQYLESSLLISLQFPVLGSHLIDLVQESFDLSKLRLDRLQVHIVDIRERLRGRQIPLDPFG